MGNYFGKQSLILEQNYHTGASNWITTITSRSTGGKCNLVTGLLYRTNYCVAYPTLVQTVGWRLKSLSQSLGNVTVTVPVAYPGRML